MVLKGHLDDVSWFQEQGRGGKRKRRNGEEVLLLLLSLLLAMMVPPTIGKTKSVDYKWYTELLCTCVKTISGIHPSNIQNLKVISPGRHCPKVKVIANLKNGKELCLDPDAPKIKKIIQKIMESDESAALPVHFLPNFFIS
ncbi:platelet basic protein-like [Pteropus medius]|uniref:platelet basic protein-like n=1 Tax=Pteropus vampyrus TaxID=132908 RepID=UPI00196AF3DD|nr:platelet basic protein-like [Pteropus giganteus]